MNENNKPETDELDANELSRSLDLLYNEINEVELCVECYPQYLPDAWRRLVDFVDLLDERVNEILKRRSNLGDLTRKLEDKVRALLAAGQCLNFVDLHEQFGRSPNFMLAIKELLLRTPTGAQLLSWGDPEADNKPGTNELAKPESFLYLIMNGQASKEIRRKNINDEVVNSLIGMGKRLFEHDVALPFPGDYFLNMTFNLASAGFTIKTASRPLSHGYFSTVWGKSLFEDATWGIAEADYYTVTDKSGLEWPVPQRPESKPWLAIVRYSHDLKCTCEYCQREGAEAAPAHFPSWLEEVEKALGYLLTKDMGDFEV
jgi:hypothetical protein